jgi:hypothetical protein
VVALLAGMGRVRSARTMVVPGFTPEVTWVRMSPTVPRVTRTSDVEPFRYSVMK